MFQGASALNLNVKGRMAVPSKHRDALTVQCEGRLTLIKHSYDCLLRLPRPTWESHREQIAVLLMSARAWQRIFPGNASDVELDFAGRTLVAPELRFAVGMTRELMLFGMGSHFEIWDAAKLVESESQVVAAGIACSVE